MQMTSINRRDVSMDSNYAGSYIARLPKPSPGARLSEEHLDTAAGCFYNSGQSTPAEESAEAMF